MPVKDYYKILELSPSATEEEIKKNFRRLAIRFHPDTNGGRRHADAWYREIKEAYEILTDPKKKSDYLKQRWLQKSKGLPLADTYPLTPHYIELRFGAMRKQVELMDHFRMDHTALQRQLLALCNDETLDALAAYDEPLANERILQHMFYCMDTLDYPYLHVLKLPLQKIAARQPDLLKKIETLYAKRKKAWWWQRNQGWIIALISIVLCAAIAFFTKGITAKQA